MAMQQNTLDLARIKELLNATKQVSTANGYMLLDDGSKVPLDTSRVGSFVGKRGTARKLLPADRSVIAYIARPNA